MQVVSNAPRHLRSYLVRSLKPHTLKGVEEHTLYLLSPKQVSGKLWRFAVYYLGQYIIIGKGVATRDVGRVQGMARYYVKAQEIRGDGEQVTYENGSDTFCAVSVSTVYRAVRSKTRSEQRQP